MIYVWFPPDLLHEAGYCGSALWCEFTLHHRSGGGEVGYTCEVFYNPVCLEFLTQLVRSISRLDNSLKLSGIVVVLAASVIISLINPTLSCSKYWQNKQNSSLRKYVKGKHMLLQTQREDRDLYQCTISPKYVCMIWCKVHLSQNIILIWLLNSY